MRRKIAYILPHLPLPGLEHTERERSEREAEIVRYTRSLGYACDLVLLTADREARTLEDDIGTWLFPVDEPSNRFNQHTSAALLQWINRQQPDLVVFKGLQYRLSRWLVENTTSPFRYAFIVGGDTSDVLLPRAEYVLAETAEQLQGTFRRLRDSGRASVLPKFMPKAAFKCSIDKCFDIINVGNCSARKNQKALIPFFGRYRIGIIGDGPLYRDLKLCAEPHELKVYMPGNVSRTEVTQLLAQSRLMVHTSLHEGLPRAVMEAFACGVPVVGYRTTLAGAFVHGQQGLLVEPDQLIEEVDSLLADEDRLRLMSDCARGFAERMCGEAAINREIERMYEVVFDGRRGAGYARRTTLLYRLRTRVRQAVSSLRDGTIKR